MYMTGSLPSLEMNTRFLVDRSLTSPRKKAMCSGPLVSFTYFYLILSDCICMIVILVFQL